MGDESSPNPAEAFDCLGHETRVAILQAFVEHRREHPETDGLSFAELRERVGMRDSGKFNYHLDKLRGRFVTQDEDTYSLSYAGEVTAAAILEGSYDTDVSVGPTELEEGCFTAGCSESVTAVYEDGELTVGCDNDHYFRTSVPPAAVAERSMDQILDLADEQLRTHVRYIRQQTCFKCTGPLQTDVDTETGTEQVTAFYESVCKRCGTKYTLPGWLLALSHPAVLGLCWEQGTVAEETYLWELRNSVDSVEQSIESDDPLRVHVTVEAAGERRTVELDDDANVRVLPDSSGDV
jgi:DNA-binding transcriptional ArsR family regulator